MDIFVFTFWADHWIRWRFLDRATIVVANTYVYLALGFKQLPKLKSMRVGGEHIELAASSTTEISILAFDDDRRIIILHSTLR